MAGLEPGGTLWSMLYAFPDDWDVSALDQTLPHIPGGAVTLLRFIGKSYRPSFWRSRKSWSGGTTPPLTRPCAIPT